jgi:hypothetical protein
MQFFFSQHAGAVLLFVLSCLYLSLYSNNSNAQNAPAKHSETVISQSYAALPCQAEETKIY